MSPQRFAILEILSRTDVPRTAAFVFEQLQRLYPRPSLEAIAKSLVILRDAGIVLEDTSAGFVGYSLNLSLPSLIANELDED